MTKRVLKLMVVALAIWPVAAIAQTSDEIQKQILKELQEIHKLLQQQQQPQQPPIADALPAEPVDISHEPFRGAANAKVALIEFSDYQCPFCQRYEKESYPQLIKDYVDTGKVKYVWRDFPLSMHQNAQKAAEAANCAAEQGKFWEMHDKLFANGQNLAPADLTKNAEALQLNVGQFQTCLDSGRMGAGITKDVTDGGSAGISGTPSFLIGLVQPNGSVKIVKRLVGARPYNDFKTAIDSAIGK